MKIPLTITKEGLAALVDAEAGTTNSVSIASIGLTAVSFAMAPTLEVLPGEFKRLAGIAGEAASDQVIHMVASDDSDESYEVSGFGLYTDTGQLFAVYSQPAGDGLLFSKSSASAFIFAADVTFEAGQAELVDFGDSNFLYPPATRTRKGVAYLASPIDVAAGTDDEKIVTPKQLALAYLSLAMRGAPNGVASLDNDGKVPPAQLPAVNSIDTFTVGSQAEMLALGTAGPGDFARRTDLVKTFVLVAAPASVLGNWVEFLSPGAPVRSVQGRIGDVVLDAADVGAVPVARVIHAAGLATGTQDLASDPTITVLAATVAEAMAGILGDRALTPSSIGPLLAQLAGKVAATRRVDSAGLASGGGDLSADRTITVPKATSSDVEAQLDDTKALTALALAGTLRSLGSNGYLRIPGTSLILMWGNFFFAGSGSGFVSRTVSFPRAFPTACFQVFTQITSTPDDNDEADEEMWVSGFSPSTFVATNGGDCASYGFAYLALGY